MYRVYGDMLSGNCYKIKLLMEFLSIEHQWQHVDILAGETLSPGFINMNSNAKIPVLQIGDSESQPKYLSESNAILNYLAEGSALLPSLLPSSLPSSLPSALPSSKIDRAKILQWQFFEQYSHEPYIAVARYINKFLGLPAEKEAEYQSKQQGGHKALVVMEQQLGETPFLVGESLTIADISLYAYTHVADEGGFDLANYPEIKQWFSRIEAHPHYVTMTRENA